MFTGWAAVCLYEGLVPWDDTAGYSDGLAWRIVAVLVALCSLACGWRPSLQLFTDRIVATGLVGRRTLFLRDLKDVQAGYDGLRLTEDGGRRVLVPFVGEKSNLASWLGREARGDAKAHVLLDAAQQWRR